MNAPKIRLLADRVLVSVAKQIELKSAGGIIIPSSATEESAMIGKVLRVSEKITKETKLKYEKVSEGDDVLFSKFAGSDVQYNGAGYKILRITDLFGVIEK